VGEHTGISPVPHPTHPLRSLPPHALLGFHVLSWRNCRGGDTAARRPGAWCPSLCKATGRSFECSALCHPGVSRSVRF
jgi:hypothetical protein